jgi:Sel1 repeat
MRGFIRWTYILSVFFLLCRAAVAEDLAALRRQAEAGDVQSQFALGQALLEGKGVPADPAQAAKWIGKAAAQAEVFTDELDKGLIRLSNSTIGLLRYWTRTGLMASSLKAASCSGVCLE